MEKVEGRGFIGPSGQLLWHMAREVGIERENVWVTNAMLCLHRTARVRLVHGGSMSIASMVRQRHRGPVWTVNALDQLKPAFVCGWHSNPLAGRKLLKVSHEYAKANPRGVVGTIVTDDHEVLTASGFAPTRDIDNNTYIATGEHRLTGTSGAVLLGSLLGDGSISRKTVFSVGHHVRHLDYLSLKEEALAGLRPSLAPPGTRPDFRVLNTAASRWVRMLWDQVYLKKRSQSSWWKKGAWLAQHLDWVSLAIWYLDDGSLDHSRLAQIAACDFGSEEVEALAAGIRRLGIDCRVGGDAAYRRIYFSVQESKKVSLLAGRIAPASLKYKLLPEHQDLFDASLYQPQPTEPFYAAARVTPFTERLGKTRRTPKPVYCLDIAGSDNFMTTAAVVHNCKARKITLTTGAVIPLDIVKAMAAKCCRQRLAQELQGVRAPVIVPLGNWALWALSDIPKARIYSYRGSRIDISVDGLAEAIARGEVSAPIRQVKS